MNRAATGFVCAAVRGLGRDAAEVETMPQPMARHASTCLRCQAEVARHRRLRRELGYLRTETHPAPPTLLPAVERAVRSEPYPSEGPERPHHSFATIAGATAAAAGAVAVAAWRRARPTG